MQIPLFSNLEELVSQIDQILANYFPAIEKIRSRNFHRIHHSIIEAEISDIDLASSSGYGYSDWGRDKIEKVFSKVFGGEDSLVRPQIVTGTQALYLALMGSLAFKRAGKSRGFLTLTGQPYPTLLPTLELIKGQGINIIVENILENPLDDFISEYKEVEFIYLQRSKGYSIRESLGINEIENIISTVRQHCENDPVIIVDNCYSEFVSDKEPCHLGADIVAGSLLKNPGGGIASTGGYLVGKKDIINKVVDFLYGPGLGKEVGPVFNKRDILLGLYLSPLIVSESLKGVVFGSHLFTNLGYKVLPRPGEELSDNVLSIVLNSKELLEKALKTVQKAGPLNPRATPAGSALPGYAQDVIMAGGTFTPGSSIELSADALLTPPWVLCLQGGFYYEHYRETCINIAKVLVD
ncbi:MAG: hypothetical protein DDT22_00281 [candidate division WS2 bacterium]|uniref:Cystathionine beta-lyase family protein involved in aluminum resistance n=1 Tax=Candidatus Hakubella thermalkaliphila TaxID=2754717 RepID=A0A6V8P6R0_9ACTN|nr:methionine gamma-lyase family protein [Candidatus Hakubella thermalkaliphila]MBT9164221.1 hypothetical protein [Candidatus Lithacetigena glycinireducens]MBT9174621.1 hypothetical protein [Candidatus Lithacetigena glycinireducens]GFP27650.1 hypothetical protein HKBW3S33_01061 [Candidatus Hakubella thermalkaliphila]GFP42412.1 hypothetical protein HKBW3C_01538 [Candidatus Hakubella thermalkaliphila]